MAWAPERLHSQAFLADPPVGGGRHADRLFGLATLESVAWLVAESAELQADEPPTDAAVVGRASGRRSAIKR